MAGHIEINIQEVTPKLYKTLNKIMGRQVMRNLFDNARNFEKINAGGLNIVKLSKDYSEYKYPMAINNGGDFIESDDFIDLKGIAVIEIHYDENFKLKKAYLVA